MKVGAEPAKGRPLHTRVTPSGSIGPGPSLAEQDPLFMPKVIKPRTLAFLAKTERRKVGASYIVTAMGMFDLAQPDAPRFETEQALWILAGKALPKGAALDIGMPKPTAELLVAGAARAPARTTTSAMVVEWAVGPLHKRLGVFGDRYWSIAGGGYAATQPQPFEEMPLVPERSFGGVGHPDNPNGAGYRATARIRAGELVALPNIEHADQLILSPEDRPAPGLCGPTDLTSPKRRRYAGTYDAHWLKHVAPAAPDDLDPRLYLTAPDDQVFAGYLQGGEPYALRGFSADEPELRGTLPAFRVRGFLARKGNDEAGDELVEIAMRADTLWLFAGARRGVLIYRGALQVDDIDAEDLSTAMIAYENARDEPRSFESYVDVWQLRSDRKSEHKHAFSESQLAPALPPETVARRNAERKALARERLDRHYAGKAWSLNRMMQKTGVPEALWPALQTDPELDEVLSGLVMPTPEEIEEGEIDLAALLDSIEVVEKKTREKVEKLSSQADTVRESFAAVRAPGADAQSVDALFAALDDLTGGSTVAALDANAARETASAPPAPNPYVEADAAADPKQFGDWRKMLLDGFGTPEIDEDKGYAEARARFLDLPEGRPLASVRPALEAVRAQELPNPALDAGAPVAAGKRIDLTSLLDSLESDTANPVAAESPAAAKIAASKERSGELDAQLLAKFPNLSKGGDAPLDTLMAAISEPAGASTDKEQAAAAAKTKLDGMMGRLDDQEASLAAGMARLRRSAPEPIYPQQKMTPALARRFGQFVTDEYHGGLDLRGRDLAGADLSGVDLSGVDLEGAMLERTNLTGARLAGARLVDAALTGATLDDADLSDADLTGANLSKCHAHNADFSRCRLSGRTLFEADFTGSKFRGAQLEKLQVLKCIFDGADFSGAKLMKMTVLQTSLAQTLWDGADLETMPFTDLSLSGARFRGTRLFRCVFLKVRAAGCDFGDADLTRSSFIGEVDLTGANFAAATGSESTFHEVQLAGSNFNGGTFNRATFVKSDLADSSFRLASLKGALFGGANLAGADFVGANLLRAQLRRADLSGATLMGANLYGANLDNAILTATDLTGANLAKTLLAVDSHVG